MKTIAGPAMLYAHAIAIEREAAARYAELAARMRDLGNDAVGARRRSNLTTYPRADSRCRLSVPMGEPARCHHGPVGCGLPS